MTYTPTIGLEIHAELNTNTKMFCSSKNDADETRPNTNVCPVCLAHPGTLPVINKEAVRHVLRVGRALGGKIADYTEFDRKNYFYPDIPKGYQISQYEHPLISGGELSGVQITRIHLEEDTARSSHAEGSEGSVGTTLLDYNRAGVPLMELVTEPVVTSAEQAGEFARELQLMLRYLGASHANMEKGEMRVEANISISKTKEFGTKVEVKNLNSFRSVERAIAYEIERQTKLLESGEHVIQETRGWDEVGQKTFSQRKKEVAADYRYFPDPDLPSLELSSIPEFAADVLDASTPELPVARRDRYLALGLKSEDADMFVRSPLFGDYFDGVIDGLPADDSRIKLSANYLANDVANLSRDIERRDTNNQAEISVSRDNFVTVINLLADKKISSRGAKDILKACSFAGADAARIAQEMGLLVELSQDSLNAAITEVLAENEAIVNEFKAGKTGVLKYLIGQAMKKTKGVADPESLNDLLISRLKG